MLRYAQEQNLGGYTVARRNRFRELESLMIKVFAGDTAAFILYLFFAGKGWNVVKIIVAVLILAVSILALAWLFLTKEIFRRRSLWMVTGFGAIVLCVLVSLVLKYPCPPVVADTTGTLAVFPFLL